MSDHKSFPEATFDCAYGGESILVSLEIGNEVYREYDWPDRATPYRINRPTSVEYRMDGTTHRVFDHNDVMHVVPAPGYFGCVVRVKYQPEN